MGELRSMIREVLAEEIQALKASMQPGAITPVVHEVVSLQSDSDLSVFVHRILDMALDPVKRQKIASGQHKFTLRAGAPHLQTISPSAMPTPAPSVAPATTAQSGPEPKVSAVRQQFSKGVLTEREIEKLPQGTRVITLDKSVRLTPLAKDELRRRNIKIERTTA